MENNIEKSTDELIDKLMMIPEAQRQAYKRGFDAGRKSIIDELKNEIGECKVCGKITIQKNKFTDDLDNADGVGWYYDFCHDECYEYIKEKL